MPSNHDQQSSHGSCHEKGQTTVAVLDERRRAALAEIDNAPFSYVIQFNLLQVRLNPSIVGFMSRFA
jgi:hypothetical protein